jgi:hypothetical protein
MCYWLVSRVYLVFGRDPNDSVRKFRLRPDSSNPNDAESEFHQLSTLERPSNANQNFNVPGKYLELSIYNLPA